MTQGCVHDILKGSKTDVVSKFVDSLDGDLAVGVEEAEGDFSLQEVACESEVGEWRRVVGGEGGEGGGGLVGEFIDEEKGQTQHSEDDVAEAGSLQPEPKGHYLESLHWISPDFDGENGVQFSVDFVE